MNTAAIFPCITVAADFLTEPVCNILSTTRDRNNMVDWTAVGYNNKKGLNQLELDFSSL